MSKKHYDNNGKRIYTEKDINALLNNSETAFRVRMLRRFKRAVSVAIAFYGIVFAVLAIYFMGKWVWHDEKNDPYACIKDPQTPVIGYNYGEGGKVVGKKVDETDFTLSTDEEFLIARLEGIGVSLLDLSFAKEEIDLLFKNHEKVLRENGLPHALLLRFRAQLKTGEVIELAMPRYGDRLICTRAHVNVLIPVSEIKCFRCALSGNEYKDDVLMDLKRRGVRSVPRGGVADCCNECMSNEEARKLMYLMVMEAEATRFDWGSVLRICTLGVWNKFHPIQSCLITLVLLLIFVIVQKKFLK